METTTAAKPEVIHCEACKERDERLWQRRLLWKRSWPNHCRDCMGHGEEVLEVGIFVLCDCLAVRHHCPRCGFAMGRDLAEAMLKDRKACKCCGWKWGQGMEDAAPPLRTWQCECEMDADIRATIERRRHLTGELALKFFDVVIPAAS